MNAALSVRSRISTLAVVFRLLLASLVAVVSGWYLLVLFAFSSMSGLPSGSTEWWGAALSRLYLYFDPGIGSWPLSVVLLVSGYFAVRDLVTLGYRGIASMRSNQRSTPPAPSPLTPLG